MKIDICDRLLRWVNRDTDVNILKKYGAPGIKEIHQKVHKEIAHDCLFFTFVGFGALVVTAGLIAIALAAWRDFGTRVFYVVGPILGFLFTWRLLVWLLRRRLALNVATAAMVKE